MKAYGVYTVKHHFCTEDSQCTHVLVQTGDGYTALVEVQPFVHAGGIKISMLKTSLALQNFVTECAEVVKGTKFRVAFLTHLGVDISNANGHSLFFKDPKSDVPKLQLGVKFSMPVVYLKDEDMDWQKEGPSLFNLMAENENLSVFYDLIVRSNCRDILNGGVLTVFAPDNAMLEKAYGPGGRSLKSKSERLDGVVGSYVAVGVYGNKDANGTNYTGTMTTLTNENLTVKNGIPVIPGQKIQQIEPWMKARNGILSVITSTDVFPHTKSYDFITRNASLPSKTVKVSTYEVTEVARKLLDVEISFAQKVRAELKANLRVMMMKLKELDELDEDIERAGQEGELTTFYLDNARRAAKVIALHIPSNELTKNVNDL